MTTTTPSKQTAPANPSTSVHAKVRTPRLGRGLSSLMAHAVHVPIPVPAAPTTPPAAPATPAATTLPPIAAPVAITATPASPATHPAPLATKRTQPTPAAPPAPAVERSAPVDSVQLLALDTIVPNPHQPRQKFDQASLERLAESIRSAGVMQPVIVRTAKSAKAGHPQYELVAGERRWRAARLAGLDRIPALTRTLDDKEVAEWALIENLQREDLNPIERAEAFRNLAELFKLSHDQIASRVGVERSTVSNSLRLLVLHHDVQQLIRDNLLSLGQAKALAGVLDPQQQVLMAKRAIRDAWSVRRVESAVRDLLGLGGNGATTADQPTKPATRTASHLVDLEQQISRQLGTKVHLRPGRKKGSGSMTIEFYSLDQFDTLLSRLGVTAE